MPNSDIDNVFNYVMESPENTNPNVLRNMLNNLKSGSGGSSSDHVYIYESYYNVLDVSYVGGFSINDTSFGPFVLDESTTMDDYRQTKSYYTEDLTIFDTLSDYIFNNDPVIELYPEPNLYAYSPTRTYALSVIKTNRYGSDELTIQFCNISTDLYNDVSNIRLEPCTITMVKHNDKIEMVYHAGYHTIATDY